MSRRLLVVNVHYAPHSYGGATVLAENVTRLLAEEHDWQVLVVTAVIQPHAAPYSLIRYRAKGVDVIGVNVPTDRLTPVERYDNPAFNERFEQIIEMFEPDIAHVHCVQNIGATFLASLERANVPIAITIHDCWWICERQFMINSSGRYCNQTKIDPVVCDHCTTSPRATRRRRELLTEMLDKASLYLFPSKFHMDLHIANGLPAEKCVVNKNGVKFPDPGYAKKPITDPDVAVRFGFVGGPGPAKGAPLILRAFEDLKETNYEFVVVDALQNIGKTWQSWDWTIPGKLRFHPAYTAESMDEFFSTIDVLLFPTQWKESFGLAVREALARDIWVIATDAGGVVEDCTDGVNSSVVPMDGKTALLKKAIHCCIKNKYLKNHQNPHSKKIHSISGQANKMSEYLNIIAK